MSKKPQTQSPAQMLERVMQLAELLAQRSQAPSDSAQTRNRKTQSPRSAVE